MKDYQKPEAEVMLFDTVETIMDDSTNMDGGFISGEVEDE